jgi:hypothetical protein
MRMEGKPPTGGISCLMGMSLTVCGAQHKQQQGGIGKAQAATALLQHQQEQAAEGRACRISRGILGCRVFLSCSGVFRVVCRRWDRLAQVHQAADRGCSNVKEVATLAHRHAREATL